MNTLMFYTLVILHLKCYTLIVLYLSILTRLHVIIYRVIITDDLTGLNLERIDIRSVMHNLM